MDRLLAPPETPARKQTPDWYRKPEAKYRQPGGKTWKELRALPEKQRREMQRAFNRENGKRMNQTRFWWLDRMAKADNPAEEKRALFWHGHFATSYQKVRNPTPMLGQNLMFREVGQRTLPDLLEALSADPAMLMYLDNYRSNRNKPNENYARELMELFSLGEGHYSEDDVKNAARAFTGWTLHPTLWEFRYEERRHDPGHKRFMGDSGRFDGRDIIDRIVALPRASEYLAERMWAFYASDLPNSKAIQDVALTLRKTNHDLDAGFRALFLHEDFYHPSVIRGKIKSPIDLCVGLARTLACPLDLGKQIQNACSRLGQSVFDPPSVKGWDGGPAWITASSLAMRYDFAERLLKMNNSFDVSTVLPDRDVTREQARDQLLDRFYFSRLRESDRVAVDRVLAGLPPPPEWQHREVITVLNHLVQQPQYQLM